MHACMHATVVEYVGVRGPADEGGEGRMEGRVNAQGSGILFCHLSYQAEWLTGCLSAQRTGMIRSWPAENGLASFTYVHISQPLSCCVCVCVCMQ